MQQAIVDRLQTLSGAEFDAARAAAADAAAARAACSRGGTRLALTPADVQRGTG